MPSETVRVLYHLNGITQVARESAYTPGPSVLEIPTAEIPESLRQIGARFVAELKVDGIVIHPAVGEIAAR